MALASATASAAVLNLPFLHAKCALAKSAVVGKPAGKKPSIPAFKSDAEFIKLDDSYALSRARRNACICSLETSRRSRRAAISASAHRRQALFGSGMNSSGMKCAFPTRGGTQIHAASPTPTPEKKSDGDPQKPSIPPWAKWVADIVYKRIRPLEDEIERTAEDAIQVIETVAEATENIATEVGSFSGNENIKQAAAEIKTAAAMIDEDAHIAQNLINKVDEIKEEVDSVVESFIGSGEEAMKKEMEEEMKKKAMKKPE